MPNGRVPPSTFGISTRRTGGGRQPVPELIEVVCKISLKCRNRLSVYSSRSLVGLHLLEGFPDFPFGDPQRSPTSLLTTAACGGLRSAPDCRPRRVLLHLSYSCVSPYGPAILVTHGQQRKLRPPMIGL